MEEANPPRERSATDEEANPPQERSPADEEEIPKKYNAIIEVEDDSPGPLTVGIELEVLFPTLPSKDSPDPHPSHHGDIYKGKGQAHAHAATEEEERVTDDEDDDDDEEAAFDEWLLSFLRRLLPLEEIRSDRDDEFYHPHDNIPKYDAWRVTQDHSVMYEEPAGPRLIPSPSPPPGFHWVSSTSSSSTPPSGYHWVSREITSAVLSPDSPCGIMAPIILMCHALRRARVHLNDTTSVHVHVGRGDSAFSLVTLKKFATLLWLTDSAILALHGPSRQQHQSDNEYCRPVTVESALALTSLAVLQAENARPLLSAAAVDRQRRTEAQMREFLPAYLCEEQDRLLPAQVRRLWGAETVEEVARLMVCPERISGRGSVGFRRFLPAGKTGGNTHTLKWRQMGGCLDPWPILHWIDFCRAFTNFARLSDAAGYKALIRDLLRSQGRFTGLDLLGAFGLTRARVYFAERLKAFEEGRAELYEGEKDGELFLKPLDWPSLCTRAV